MTVGVTRNKVQRLQQEIEALMPAPPIVRRVLLAPDPAVCPQGHVDHLRELEQARRVDGNVLVIRLVPLTEGDDAIGDGWTRQPALALSAGGSRRPRSDRGSLEPA